MPRETFDELCDLSDLPTKRRVLAKLGTYQGLYEVTVKPRRDTRSTQANRWYFKCVVTPFRDFLRDQGQEFTSLQCHYHLRQRFGVRLDMVNPNTGELLGHVEKETKHYDTGEFHDYAERCIAWLADTFGIVVQDSNDFAPVAAGGRA